MSFMSNITRPEGDPKILQSGPSSLGPMDRMGRSLGWVGIGLGVTELLAARQITRVLGVKGHEMLIRAFGIREIASGMLTLSTERETGLWTRLIGDGIDISLLIAALNGRHSKRGSVGIALILVAGITLLDAVAAGEVSRRHAGRPNGTRDYSGRSGFPGGLEAARKVARR